MSYASSISVGYCCAGVRGQGGVAFLSLSGLSPRRIKSSKSSMINQDHVDQSSKVLERCCQVKGGDVCPISTTPPPTPAALTLLSLNLCIEKNPTGFAWFSSIKCYFTE